MATNSRTARTRSAATRRASAKCTGRSRKAIQTVVMAGARMTSRRLKPAGKHRSREQAGDEAIRSAGVDPEDGGEARELAGRRGPQPERIDRDSDGEAEDRGAEAEERRALRRGHDHVEALARSIRRRGRTSPPGRCLGCMAGGSLSQGYGGPAFTAVP